MTLKAEEGNEKNEATSENNQSIKEKRKEGNQHPRGIGPIPVIMNLHLSTCPGLIV